MDRTGLTITRGLSLANRQQSAVAVRSMGERRKDGRELVVARDLVHILDVRRAMYEALFGGGFFCLLISMSSGLVLGLRQMRRIRGIHGAVLRITKGELGQRLPTSGRDELDMLTELVNHMLDDIERLMQEVKGITDSIAHDLRTPLARIRALLPQLLEVPSTGTDGSRILLRTIEEADALMERFSAMMRISEIGALKRQAGFTSVDIQPLALDLCELYGPLAEDRLIDLQQQFENVPFVRGDRALLFDALGNILDNAVKFTSAGGRITVALGKTPSGPIITISDNGPGIPEEERDAVLQRSYRSFRTNSVRGAGLGLSIVTAILHVDDFANAHR